MSSLFRSFLIVAIFFGLEKGLGFLRQVFLGQQFGLSATLDAFNAANNIPDLLFVLISGGTLSMALIPVLSEYGQKGGRHALWDLFSRLANLVFLVTAGLSILVAIFAGPLVSWRLGIAPGFTAEQRLLVVELMRLNLLATLLFSLGGLAIAGLQANQHFLLPAIAPSMYDLGMLFGVLVLAPQEAYQFGPIRLPAYGLGIHGVVYGTILGAALFLIIQLPGMFAYQFRWSPRIGLHHPGVIQVLSLMGPRLLTMACIQLIFLAQDNIASRQVAGSVSALVYGWLFMQVPETLIGTAIATVLLPTLSEQAARQDSPAFGELLKRALRLVLALGLPAAVIVACSIQPLVGLLGFDPSGIARVAWVGRAFLLGLVGHAMLEIAARAFYARQDARTPLYTYAIGALIFIFLAIPLSIALGTTGIALANSLTFTAIALFLLTRLRHRLPDLLKLGSTTRRAALAGLLAALVTLAVQAIGVRLAPSLPALVFSLGGIALAALAVIPIIWTEIKILIKL